MSKMNYSSNLQLTHFIAAVLVIVSHSFLLTQGNIEKEWLYVLTNGQMTWGIISGNILPVQGILDCKKCSKEYVGNTLCNHQVKASSAITL